MNLVGKTVDYNIQRMPKTPALATYWNDTNILFFFVAGINIVIVHKQQSKTTTLGISRHISVQQLSLEFSPNVVQYIKYNQLSYNIILANTRQLQKWTI